MSFASGFFNSVNHDRLYDATDISRLFDGLIRDGIFASIGDCLIVKPSNGMTVTVGTGRAWFNHTWSYNDALYPVTVPASEILTKRIDAIVLEINSVESVRANSIKLVKGTPAANPSKPSLTNNKEVHQYPLAYITVEKEVTSIRQADIENCVGTNVCPFVSGILEVISIDKLIPQWKDTLNRFVETNTANFNTWMNGEKQNYQAWLASAKKEITDWENSAKSDYNTWYNGIKNSYTTWYNSIKNSYDQWFATIKAAYNSNWATFQQWEKDSQAQFDTWFDNIKNKLEGDLATKLTKEVEDLSKEKVSLIESTSNNLTGTVEAPLLLSGAARNLIPYPYKNSSGVTSRGVTMTYTSEGNLSFSGTIKRENGLAPIFGLLDNAQTLFETFNTDILICKHGPDMSNDDLYFFFQVFRKNGTWIKNSSIIKKTEYDWSQFYLTAVIEFSLKDGKDATTKISNLRIITNETDFFVPYSGYKINTYGRNLIAYPYVNTEWAHNGLTFKVVGEGKIQVNGTATTAQITYEVANSTTKEILLRLLRAGKDLMLAYKATNDSLRVYISIYKTNGTWVANISNNEILKHDAYDWGSHNVNIMVQDDGQHTFSNATITNLIVTISGQSTAFEPFKESTITINKDTKFPNLDLKTFDGVTNILSVGNLKSYHADAANGKYLLEAVKKSAESGGVSIGTSSPSNPKAGDIWIDTTYTVPWLRYWNGSSWPTIESQIHVETSKPSNPFPGQVHYDPSTKKMSVYVAAGGSYGGPGWYDVGGSDSQGGTYYGSSAPSNTKLLWIDTSGIARYYNGSVWTAIAATWG